ncbi:MAG: phosphoribosylglycinamide formyltransferase [Gammaproteobacteria bacterium]|nr:phosphoribosylglycinamide formyltransferase [Gammaproteobacteria bacterium]
MHKLPIVILISGRGSNMQAILEQAAQGELGVDIRAVISNRPDAEGLQTAAAAGITTAIVDHRDYADREQYDQALRVAIDSYQPALVVLAGFMRILTPAFVQHYQGRLINIHPSLLPAFRGLNTHQRALDAGVSEHGASVHYVTEELDGGPVVAQFRVPVLDDDTAASLGARVLKIEHHLYPTVIGWIATGRLRYRNGMAYLDDQPLLTPVSVSDSRSEHIQ